ncbi:MAG: TonB family protein [Desulfococcaceae bacterium]|jgi:protein TonB|nr:TonB family protein [Desulfococcaceae bacterium]
MKPVILRSLSVTVSLLINAGIVIALPQITGTQPLPLKAERMQPVLLREYRPRSPETEKKQKEETERKKELPKKEKYPQMHMRPPEPRRSAARPPRLKIQKPEMKFRINPLLAATPFIAPPAPQPLPQSPLKAEPEVRKQTVAKAPPAPLPSRPSEFQAGEVDQSPRLLRKVDPEYPRRAKRRNIQGKVTVKFLVSSEGHVEKPVILNANPEGVFEQSVLRALAGWKFEPGYYQGKAVPTWMILPIQFSLKG